MAQIVTVARSVLATEGREALTMRRLATELGIPAPSLYKHLPNKAALEAALITQALSELGQRLHAVIKADHPVRALLREYRAAALAEPHLYRLATVGRLDRAALPPGLEEWAGQPFYLVTQDPHQAQALWSYAHGMVILELDDRYPAGSDLGATWRAGAMAFGSR